MENKDLLIKRERTSIQPSENSEKVHFINTIQRDQKTFKIWECGICSREFQHQYCLARHLPVHSDIRNYRCSNIKCGKTFRQLSTLSQHMAIHSTERPFVCDQCDKSFNRNSTLISHKKIHSDVKQYKCKYCEKSFHQKGNLKNHIFIHSNERPYVCNFCDQGFNQMSNLVCHKKKCHPEKNPTGYKKKEPQIMNKQDVIEFMMPAIKTDALTKAKANNEIPFALLHLISEKGVIVRITDCGVISLIKEATIEDYQLLNKTEDPTFKISLPMVADIHQIMGLDGTLEYVVRPPATNYNFLTKNEPIKPEIKPVIKEDQLPTKDDGIENDAWLTDENVMIFKTETDDHMIDVEGFNEESSSSSLDKNEYSLLINALHSDGFVPDLDGIKNYFAGNDISFNF